jgi:hypothetical protein
MLEVHDLEAEIQPKEVKVKPREAVGNLVKTAGLKTAGRALR